MNDKEIWESSFDNKTVLEQESFNVKPSGKYVSVKPNIKPVEQINNKKDIDDLKKRVIYLERELKKLQHDNYLLNKSIRINGSNIGNLNDTKTKEK